MPRRMIVPHLRQGIVSLDDTDVHLTEIRYTRTLRVRTVPEHGYSAFVFTHNTGAHNVRYISSFHTSTLKSLPSVRILTLITGAPIASGAMIPASA